MPDNIYSTTTLKIGSENEKWNDKCDNTKEISLLCVYQVKTSILLRAEF